MLAAVAIADAEGLAALSMRRIAAELGGGPMSLYRYVSGKDDLVHLMAEHVFGEERLTGPGPGGWRAELERIARLQWEIYRRHLWVAQIVSFTRPLLVPDAMAHVEWALRALDGLGLSLPTMRHVVVALSAYVRGIALSRLSEIETEHDTGVTNEQWWESHDAKAVEIVRAGDFPMLARYDGVDDGIGDLDALFEFGLQRLLDGVAAFLATGRGGPAGAST